MKKLFLICASLLLTVTAQAQIPIKVCADGSSVSVNGYCPEEYSQSNRSYTSAPNWFFGVVYHAPKTDIFTWETFSTTDRFRNPRPGGMGGDAQKDCNERAGGGDTCVLTLIFHSCFAIASDGSYYANSRGENLEQAQERALRACNGSDGQRCEIKASDCYR